MRRTAPQVWNVVFDFIFIQQAQFQLEEHAILKTAYCRKMTLPGNAQYRLVSVTVVGP